MLPELDVVRPDLGGEACLGQIVLVEVDAEHARRAAPLHLDRVEAAVAADVEHGLAGEVLGQGLGEAAELHVGIIAEEMVRRGPDAAPRSMLWNQGPSASARAADLRRRVFIQSSVAVCGPLAAGAGPCPGSGRSAAQRGPIAVEGADIDVGSRPP